MTATNVPTAPMPSLLRDFEIRPVGIGRLVRVELRKMFDTQSGRWVLFSIGILATVATLGVLLFAPDDSISYGTFLSALSVPMGALLPVVAILAVTSEWSQRTAVVTFILEPRRERVMLAKALANVLVGTAAMALALGIGALGNLAGSYLADVPTDWDDVDAGALLAVMLASVLGLLVGYGFAALIRNSPGALVGFFAWYLVLPTIGIALASWQEGFEDVQPWLDLSAALAPLNAGDWPRGAEWGQLLVSGTIWLILPTTAGLYRVLRSEVK